MKKAWLTLVRGAAGALCSYASEKYEYRETFYLDIPYPVVDNNETALVSVSAGRQVWLDVQVEKIGYGSHKEVDKIGYIDNLIMGILHPVSNRLDEVTELVKTLLKSFIVSVCAIVWAFK